MFLGLGFNVILVPVRELSDATTTRKYDGVTSGLYGPIAFIHPVVASKVKASQPTQVGLKLYVTCWGRCDTNITDLVPRANEILCDSHAHFALDAGMDLSHNAIDPPHLTALTTKWTL